MRYEGSCNATDKVDPVAVEQADGVKLVVPRTRTSIPRLRLVRNAIERFSKEMGFYSSFFALVLA